MIYIVFMKLTKYLQISYDFEVDYNYITRNYKETQSSSKNKKYIKMVRFCIGLRYTVYHNAKAIP